MRIDAHQHFWRYDAAAYPWIGTDMGALRRDFLPVDLEPLLRREGFRGCIAVQARQSLTETRWLLDLAGRHTFILGVVGWVDLRAPDIADTLAELTAHPALRGVRHVLQDEPDPALALTAAFQRGIAALGPTGLVYDILIHAHQLPVATALAERFPEQPFVLDHLAKPPLASGALAPWATALRRLAALPNVTCKLSGLVTEARADQPATDYLRVMDAALDAFGPERLIFGTDWPVCTAAAPYERVVALAAAWADRRLDSAGRRGLFGGNAARVYGLPAAARGA